MKTVKLLLLANSIFFAQFTATCRIVHVILRNITYTLLGALWRDSKLDIRFQHGIIIEKWQ